MYRTFSIMLMVFAPMLVAASCGEKANPTIMQNDGFAAEDQTDTMSQAGGEAALLAALTEAPSASTGDEAATAAADGVSGTYGNCVTSTVAANVVTYDLQDCTGPWGFLTITGEIEGTYTIVEPGIIRGVFTATGLSVNDGLADLNATVEREVIDNVKRFEVTTNWLGRTAKGDITGRNGQYVSEIRDDECLAIDGMWVTTVGIVSWDTDVTNFDICRGGCPAAGGNITWTGQRGRTITLNYDGDSTADWVNSEDESGTVNLACGS